MVKIKAIVLGSLLASGLIGGSVSAMESPVFSAKGDIHLTAWGDRGGWSDSSRQYDFGDAIREQCGPYDQINSSAIFGNRDQYVEYGKLGQLSAEIDRITNMDRGTYVAVNSTMSSAKVKIDEVKYAIMKNEKFRDKHIDSINITEGIATFSNGVFNGEQAQLRKEEVYVINKAYTSSLARMKQDGRRPTRDDDGEPSSYEKWQQCKEWWGDQQRLNPWQ